MTLSEHRVSVTKQSSECEFLSVQCVNSVGEHISSTPVSWTPLVHLVVVTMETLNNATLFENIKNNYNYIFNDLRDPRYTIDDSIQ